MISPRHVLWVLSLALVGHPCSAQASDEQASSTWEQAAAQQRIVDCTRALPILVPEASATQIQQACRDKYGLEGSFVNACLVQVRQIFAAEGKVFPKDELSFRNLCSARERVPGIAQQPFDDQPAAPAQSVDGIVLIWPSVGRVVSPFTESSKGIQIAGPIGSPVVAAADGKVVYSGSGLRGYGHLVILKHSADFLTAYAHNNKIFVKEGDLVTQGKQISELGDSDTEKPQLHFEVRYKGKPVNPLDFLSAR